MSLFDDLIEDLRMIVPLAVIGRGETLGLDPTYQAIKDLVAQTKDDPQLEVLNAEELRALESFKITVFRAGPMEPTTGRKHIAAMWRGLAKQACLKLESGKEIHELMKKLMEGGIG